MMPDSRLPAALMLVLLTAAGPSAAVLSADERAPQRFKGRTLSWALAELQKKGLKIIYSSELVRPEMIVREEPRGRWPHEVLDELLAPHGLQSTAGPSAARLIVKAPPAEKAPPPARAAPARMGQLEEPAPRPTYLEHISVWAGDRSVRAEAPIDRAELDRNELERSPEVGPDPLLPVGRLAGVATTDGIGGLHVRGGATRETKIVFDGLELYEPFHLKDRGGPISLLDSQNVSEVGLLSGGFPAEFGGHMSAVVDMQSVTTSRRLSGAVRVGSEALGIAGQGELGGRIRWLAAARSGNPSRLLDALGADPAYRPPFSDFFGKAEYRPDEKTVVSLHVLGGDDEVEGGDNDQVLATLYGSGTLRSWHTQRYAWMTFARAFSPRLLARTIVSTGWLNSDRLGSSPRIVDVRDHRAVTMIGVKQDWLRQSGEHLFKWGVDLKRLRASYSYVSISALGRPVAIESDPRGVEAGGYIADRVRVSRDLSVEAGLRWDRQSYTPDRHGTLSPRINAVYRIGDRTSVRAGWGYFYQPQRIHELQVEDGIDRFFGAARAEHRVVSWEHDFDGGVTLRLSGYQKRMSGLSPRFENVFDPFGFFPEAERDRVMIAPESARADGIEVAAGRRVQRTTGWWAAYSVSRADDRIDGRWVPRAWDQRHALSAGFVWKPRPRWDVTLAGTQHSGRPATPLDWNAEIGQRNSLRLAPYSRLDARLSRSFALRSSEILASVTLTDAFDHQPVLGVADVGRLVTVGLAWRF